MEMTVFLSRAVKVEQNINLRVKHLQIKIFFKKKEKQKPINRYLSKAGGTSLAYLQPAWATE